MIGDKLTIEKVHTKAARGVTNIVLPIIQAATGRFVISIAGESGSGKSEIASVLSDLLAENNVKSVIIQQDDYFVYPPLTNLKMRRKDIGLVGASEVRLSLLDENLKDIVDGKDEIEKPLVSFEEDRFTTEPVKLQGVKVVIVEGTYTTVLENVHQRVFIDRTNIDTRESRIRRSREAQDEFLEKILEIEHKIISAHKAQASIIVSQSYEVRPNGGKKT